MNTFLIVLLIFLVVNFCDRLEKFVVTITQNSEDFMGVIDFIIGVANILLVIACATIVCGRLGGEL